MNVYDFDETIYGGDSTKDFILFLYKSQPCLLRFLPAQTRAFLAYSRGEMTKTDFKSCFYKVFTGVDRIEDKVEVFWDEAQDRIYPYYPAQQRPDDLVISASPEFLLWPMCRRLGITHLLASRVNAQTGAHLSPNCHGPEKVRRFLEAGYDHEEVEAFYSDSCTDFPLAELAERAYMVQDGKVGPWVRPVKRGFSAFIQLSNSRNFLTILFASLGQVALVALFTLALQGLFPFVLALILAGLGGPAMIFCGLKARGSLPDKGSGLLRQMVLTSALITGTACGLRKWGKASPGLAVLLGLVTGLGGIYAWIRRAQKKPLP